MVQRICFRCRGTHDLNGKCPRGSRMSHRKMVVKRQALIERDGLQCVECGAHPDAANPIHVDHITPHIMGGGDTLSNLQLLCARCNLTKGAS